MGLAGGGIDQGEGSRAEQHGLALHGAGWSDSEDTLNGGGDVDVAHFAKKQFSG
jgi:hypothetical protein